MSEQKALPANITYFEKKCPHCYEIMKYIKISLVSWNECANVECAWLKNQPLEKNEQFEDVPVPYQSNFKRH